METIISIVRYSSSPIQIVHLYSFQEFLCTDIINIYIITSS